jgi:hypothetical protein
MADEIYLDYQSAKPVDPRVVEAMLPYFGERFGNPASLHLVGDRATAALEGARTKVASFLGALPEEIVFTSGATESNNLAVIGYAMGNRRAGDHIVMAETEHISLHNIGKALEREGFRVSKVPPDGYGRISVDKLRSRISDETILVSVGWASNEIGTVQPMADIAEMLDGSGVAAEICLADVPALPGAKTALDAGIQSSLAPQNDTWRQHSHGPAGDAAPWRTQLLSDPQTCGGLLLGVHPDQAATFCEQAKAAQLSAPSIIGHVVARQRGRPVLTLR